MFWFLKKSLTAEFLSPFAFILTRSRHVTPRVSYCRHERFPSSFFSEATQIFTLEGIPLLMHTNNIQHNLWFHVFPFSPHDECRAAFVGCSEAFRADVQWNKSLNKTNPQLYIVYHLNNLKIKGIVVWILGNAENTPFGRRNI